MLRERERERGREGGREREREGERGDIPDMDCGCDLVVLSARYSIVMMVTSDSISKCLLVWRWLHLNLKSLVQWLTAPLVVTTAVADIAYLIISEATTLLMKSPVLFSLVTRWNIVSIAKNRL